MRDVPPCTRKGPPLFTYKGPGGSGTKRPPDRVRRTGNGTTKNFDAPPAAEGPPDRLGGDPAWAKDVAACPEDWLPWNYRTALARAALASRPAA
jgi:hypothetical protein